MILSDVAAMQTVFVRGVKVDDMEEGLAVGAIAIAGFPAAVIPCFGLVDSVVVLLVIVCGVVAGLAQVARIESNLLRDLEAGAHVFGTEGDRIGTSDERGA